MPESLLVWFNLFLDDAGAVRARLGGRPVLVYEPPETAEAAPVPLDDEDYQLRTQSGVTMPVLGGAEPLAVLVEKTKDNAFQRRITVGRTANNDVVLDDQSVSRFHAFLELGEGGWALTDAGSRNGSFVGGRRLTAKRPVALDNGCTLRFGAVQLRFFLCEGFIEMLERRARGAS